MKDERDYSYTKEQQEKLLRYLVSLSIDHNSTVFWSSKNYSSTSLDGIPPRSVHHILSILQSQGLLEKINKLTTHENTAMYIKISGAGLDYFRAKHAELDRIEKLERESKFKFRVATGISILALLVSFASLFR